VSLGEKGEFIVIVWHQRAIAIERTNESLGYSTSTIYSFCFALTIVWNSLMAIINQERTASKQASRPIVVVIELGNVIWEKQ